MAQKDLIPMSRRSKEEVKRIARKGGINSGKTRRKKADLKKAMNAVLSAGVNSDQLKELLKSLNLPTTNEYALSLSVVAKGIKKGDAKVLEVVHDIVREKDKGDKAEQKARIEQIKAQTNKLNGEDSEVEYLDDVEGDVYGDNKA